MQPTLPPRNNRPTEPALAAVEPSPTRVSTATPPPQLVADGDESAVIAALAETLTLLSLQPRHEKLTIGWVVERATLTTRLLERLAGAASFSPTVERERSRRMAIPVIRRAAEIVVWSRQLQAACADDDGTDAWEGLRRAVVETLHDVSAFLVDGDALATAMLGELAEAYDRRYVAALHAGAAYQGYRVQAQDREGADLLAFAAGYCHRLLRRPTTAWLRDANLRVLKSRAADLAREHAMVVRGGLVAGERVRLLGRRLERALKTIADDEARRAHWNGPASLPGTDVG